MSDARRVGVWLLTVTRGFFSERQLSVGDVTNHKQRSVKRYQGIVLGGGFAGLSKVVSLLSVAISIPLTVRYLESERYGMWMTISSLLGVLGFADLGIGNGLVAVISCLDQRLEQSAIKRAIASSAFILSLIGLLIFSTFTAAYSFVPWSEVFGVRGALATHESGPSVVAFMVCFCVGLPFSIVQRIQLGLQESWRSYAWQCVGSLISLGGTLLVLALRLGVPWLVLAASGGPVLASMMNSIVEFGRRRPELRPDWASVDFAASIKLVRSGAIFVALQLCVVLGTASDSLIISQVDGAAGVSSYAVMYKLYQTTLIFSLFMTPLWPAMGESMARGDRSWARSAMTQALRLSLGAGLVLAALLYFFAQPLVKAWVGPSVLPSALLVAAFCGWIILSAYGGAITALLNNAQFLGLQLKIYLGASLVAVAIKVPMARWLGPAGVVWSTVAAYGLLYCIPAGFVVKRTLYART